MKPKLYLAGPMTGLTLTESEQWRQDAYAALKDRFRVFSPLRGKGFLREQGPMNSTGPQPSGGDKGIFLRDSWDVRTADAVLAYLLHAEGVSIGTCFELAWAHQHGKLAVVVMEKGGVHDHAFVRQAASLVVPDLNEAVEFLRMLATEGGGA